MARIILDAGHGGFDNGASYQGRKEKEDNLRLALAVGRILQDMGQDVVYTRTEDVYNSPWEKVGIANDLGGDLLVSLHRNASEEDNQYAGVQTLVFEDEGLLNTLAVNINRALAEVGYNNLGISVRKNLPIIRETDMPAILVETGFINTDEDNVLFEERFEDTARAIAQGIVQSLSEPVQLEGQENSDYTKYTDVIEKETDFVSPVPSKHQQTEGQEVPGYSIEIGLFAHLDNAKQLAEHLQEDGIDCYIGERGDYFAVCQGSYETLEEAGRKEKELFELGYETRICCCFCKKNVLKM